jgi:two-component system nitrogen regulation sensor histidine kinase GlnL
MAESERLQLRDSGALAVLEALSAPAMLCTAEQQLLAVNASFAQRIGTRRWHGASLLELFDDAELSAAAARVCSDERAVELRARPLPRLGAADRFDIHVATLAESARPAALLFEFKPAQAIDAAWSGQLARALAHELRNPLGGLRGAAQLLRLDPAGSSATGCIEVIESEVQRLSALAERLLAGPGVPEQRRYNVHGPLERARLLVNSEWPQCSIQRDYDPSLPDLTGDPERLTQALLNLLRNAQQSGATQIQLRSRIERHVRLGVHTWRLAIRIEVQDNGPGVPEELRDSLFLPLVTGRAEGSGFGLPTALAIAHEQGGTLRYVSERGHTAFWLLLPVQDL